MPASAPPGGAAPQRGGRSSGPLGDRPWRRFLPPGLFVLALITVWWLRRPDDRVLSTFTGQAQGTTWTVKLVTPEPLSADANVAVGQTVRAELERVDASMSTWRKDSEISLFNQHLASTPFPVSPPFAQVISLARQVSEASGGVFDVTVGPLVEAWGFGPDGERTLPTEAELTALRARVGYQRLHLEGPAEQRTLRKEAPDARVDLSAIAQGYTVDLITEALLAQGYTDLYVEVGGETRALGRNAGGRTWQVGIERPTDTEQTIHRVVPLNGTSLATSGDYRRYREQDGQRLSHTVDPRTGRPIGHRLASVTVIHASCALADAWATALNVLGPDEGLVLAQRLGLAALFLVRTPDGRWIERATDTFQGVAGKISQ